MALSPASATGARGPARPGVGNPSRCHYRQSLPRCAGLSLQSELQKGLPIAPLLSTCESVSPPSSHAPREIATCRGTRIVATDRFIEIAGSPRARRADLTPSPSPLAPRPRRPPLSRPAPPTAQLQVGQARALAHARPRGARAAGRRFTGSCPQAPHNRVASPARTALAEESAPRPARGHARIAPQRRAEPNAPRRAARGADAHRALLRHTPTRSHALPLA